MKREGNTCYKCSGPDCLSPTQTQTTACLAGTDGKSIDCYTGLDCNIFFDN